ncbi:hypothetical protein V6N11_037919 [Hibiscus sabdariffa]|uniref:Disease resistance R13L4/SHOC-2-like LRR domain-containing protein n=1 Tax=Hibiscus sabdariffa TaxID=183260 RepID=A0ABR2ADD1_9ROSI
MESKWMAMLLLVLGFLLLGGGEWCEGCLDEERLAISRLKPFFPFLDYAVIVGGPGSGSDDYSEQEDDSSVEKEESSLDCCKWESVECNPTTGRVTHLFLNLTAMNWYDLVKDEYQTNTNQRKFWYLNASLFLPFEELQYLSLSGNLIAGCVADQELELVNLNVLDLSDNPLDNSILSSLEIDGLSNLEELDISCYSERQNLTNLEELDLWYSSLPSEFIGTLPSLKKLHMYYCYSDDNLFTQIFQLKHLETLRIYGTSPGNNFLPTIGALPSLRILNLRSQDSRANLLLQSLDLLSSLKVLSLGGFNLDGTGLYSHSQNKWRNLVNLEELVLWDSSLPSNFIGTLTSLKKLHVYDCYLADNLFIQEPLGLKELETLRIHETVVENNFLQKIGTMPCLKILRLFKCGLNGTLHSQVQRFAGFCGLTNLQELDTSNNNLKGNLPECISNFTSLKSLNLSSNQFSGDIFALEALTSLESLDLSSNHFSKNISALEALTSLKSLDLSSNQFVGNVSTLKALTSLQVLSLSNNYFQIPSSLGPFFDLSQLQRFQANNNTVYVEREMKSSAPRFQLNEVHLSCCGDAGQVPQFLYYQRDLWHVDLSNINLKGGFPNWLLQNNTNLRSLNLANNSLQGHFELPFSPLTDLSRLDISKNSINGNVPIEMGVKLPSLSYLNMSRNHFHGDIPASIGDMNSLEYLDLSHNQLSGGLPEHLAMGCFSLSSLILSNNSLQGQMFSSKFNLTNLGELRLDGNHFSGKISDSLSNCTWLSTLDVSNNELVGGIPRWMENMSSLSTLHLSNNEISGEIPRWMGSMSFLEEIVMARNHLEGPFPEEFCNLYPLKLLDLSVNNISGHIPSCFSPILLSQVHLSRNNLQGPLTNAFRDSDALVTLDLSNNHLTGNIPNWIGNLSQMSYLLLNNNHFEGRIPLQLCNLGHLSLIDLSNNNLSGTIPSCLKITTWNEGSQEYVRYLADVGNVNSSFSNDEPIEFTSKNNSYSYKGRVLTYLSGIDLSCNKLTGEIPREVNNFQNIYALNLSHNSLIGSIPQVFSNLKQIESLDLSHNNLSGAIPPQLVGLYMLSYFSVAYNNLSGSTPVMTAQFSTFEESSYVGNPFLCGKPLPRNCSTSGPSSLPKGSTDKGLIDMTAFYASFCASYVVVILSIARSSRRSITWVFLHKVSEWMRAILRDRMSKSKSSLEVKVTVGAGNKG